LFAPQNLPPEPIQKVYVLEGYENLRQEKRDRISQLLTRDFEEIDHCLSVQAHKSCLFLCGSILEAVLLDWLSEIEHEDHFDSLNPIYLGTIINKLKSELGSSCYQKARDLKNYRNLIHPKVLFKSTRQIDAGACRTAIADLKEVLRGRGISIATE
jgi:hypothetical protein